jgi:RNA helicase (UPF2 interacting domain)
VQSKVGRVLVAEQYYRLAGILSVNWRIAHCHCMNINSGLADTEKHHWISSIVERRGCHWLLWPMAAEAPEPTPTPNAVEDSSPAVSAAPATSGAPQQQATDAETPLPARPPASTPKHAPPKAVCKAETCSYCDLADPQSLVRCLECGRWFCNTRGETNSAHIVKHLVYAGHHAVGLHHKHRDLPGEVLVCYLCGSK